MGITNSFRRISRGKKFLRTIEDIKKKTTLLPISVINPTPSSPESSIIRNLGSSSIYSSMENSKSAGEEDPFFDAPDEFPFYDCSTILDSDVLDSHSTSSPKSKFVEATPNLLTPSSAGLRHRRRLLSQRSRRDSFSNASEDLNCSSSGQSELNNLVNEDASSSGFGERKRKYSRDLKDSKADGAKLESDKGELKSEGLEESRTEGKSESSTITSLINDRIDNEGATDSSSTVREHDESHYNFLVSIAGLVIKAVGFQFSVFVSFISFPLWALYFSFMFVLNPFQTIKRGKDYMAEKFTRIYDVVMQVASPFMSEWIKENKSVLSMMVRFGWALFWSIYVCSVLFTLLVSGFIVSGLMMRRFVEEPFQLKQPLNFDYTKDRPVAFVPITACPDRDYVDSVGRMEVVNAGRERVISPSHKLQATVELLLPESDYNRNLGVFQVRVEFMSANGKTLASLSHPCMLQFKSGPIRLLLTFFKILPLVAGYVSESQSIHLNFKGFTEGDVPTECVKVVMEQRAEFRPGAGIPEVYDAYILLESELPFLKRILWCWRKTIFVWTGTMLFMMELMFTIVCCRPLIMPRKRGGSGGGGDRNHGRANNQS